MFAHLFDSGTKLSQHRIEIVFAGYNVGLRSVDGDLQVPAVESVESVECGGRGNYLRFLLDPFLSLVRFSLPPHNYSSMHESSKYHWI